MSFSRRSPYVIWRSRGNARLGEPRNQKDPKKVVCRISCHAHDSFLSFLLLQEEGDDTSVKIADFGFAKKVTGENCLKTLCGTAQYVAPEILDMKCDGYDQRADVWSLGIVTYVLLGGYAPFDGGPLEKLANDVMRGEFEFHEDYWSDISPAAKDLITSMLQVRPERRITAGEALSCKWMEVEEESLTLKDLSCTQKKLRANIPPVEKVKTTVHAVRWSCGCRLFRNCRQDLTMLISHFSQRLSHRTSGCSSQVLPTPPRKGP
jgi:serine/threonine protein kinase